MLDPATSLKAAVPVRSWCSSTDRGESSRGLDIPARKTNRNSNAARVDCPLLRDSADRSLAFTFCQKRRVRSLDLRVPVREVASCEWECYSGALAWLQVDLLEATEDLDGLGRLVW